MRTSGATATQPAVELESGSDTGRGIAQMVLAVGLYSIMDAMIKWLGPSYPTMELVFFRSLFAFIPIAYVLWRSGSLAGLRTKNLFGHGAHATGPRGDADGRAAGPEQFLYPGLQPSDRRVPDRSRRTVRSTTM